MQRRRFCKQIVLGTGACLTAPLHALVPLRLQSTMQNKIDNFNADFADDIYLPPPRLPLLNAIVAKLGKVQALVGFARFNLLSFDECLRIANDMPKIGAFSAAEKAFLDEIFHTDARIYGFHGIKVSTQLTASFAPKEYLKIEGSGHYLFQGPPLALFRKMQLDVGSELVMTSGIRNILKQTHLFLNKAVITGGNLSRASRSLAPPGHSFHGISDFDVGMRGWGARNFSEEFANSTIFQKLASLGYTKIRYHKTNTDGVRYEPWHIKVG